MCCFSSVVDNPLLWSHYGDQHRGLCIGYTLSRNPELRLHEVLYDGDRMLLTSLIADSFLNNDPKSQELLDRNVLLKQAPSWSYECEWRLFSNKGVQDLPLGLKEVTFGLRCPNFVVHKISKALESRENEVEFYEIFEILGRFDLRREPVNIDEMRANLPRTAKSGVETFEPIDEA